MKAVVLISGNGSNLQAIIDNSADIGLLISCVISNKADAFGLKRAQTANIPTLLIEHQNFTSRQAFDDKLAEKIDWHQPDIIILAGFMRILSKIFVEKYAGKIINIHPSLLPQFKGLNTHQRALDAGVETHGATVHFVINKLDSGAIIMQKSIAITATDTAKSLQEKIQKIEHILYPLALKKISKKLS